MLQNIQKMRTGPQKYNLIDQNRRKTAESNMV